MPKIQRLIGVMNVIKNIELNIIGLINKNKEKKLKCPQTNFKVKIATSLVVVGFGVIDNFIHILSKTATTLDL